MTGHIILLGFKHVGKSTVGKHLGKRMQMPFIDLDDRIKENYHRQQGEALSCREIFHRHGENFFRDYETEALREVLQQSPAVIALGGGTPLRPENQNLLKSHLLVYLTAEPQVIYKRMIARGVPAFFPKEQDPQQFFQQLWSQREKVYAKLANITVDNTHAVAQTVALILRSLEKTG